MQFAITVENMRCGGCANTITKKLLENTKITAVNIDIENKTVIIDSADSDENIRNEAVNTLLKLGYPEKGSEQGMAAAVANKTKSFVSCAVGKITQE